MADICDQADEQNAAALAAEIASKRQPAGPEPTGFCHNCGEALTGKLRWCNNDCRDDYEKRAGRFRG